MFVLNSIIPPKNLNRDHSLWKKVFQGTRHCSLGQFGPDHVKKNDAPMCENPFHLSAYIPKQNMNAADLIEATLLQSLWISNLKKYLAGTTISKVLARWFKNKLHHSTKETRTNPSYRPALANCHSMYYQEFCTIESYKKKNH